MDKKYILIVEDDPHVNELYTTILGDKYNLLISTDTIDARKKLKRNKIDLMLLDLMLPDESGDKFLEVLRKTSKYKNLKVIIVSALTGVWDAIKDAHSDVICIPKPFDENTLLSEIEKKLQE